MTLNAAARAALMTIAILIAWAVVFRVANLPGNYFSTGLSVITVFFILLFGEKALVGKKK